MNSIRYFDCFGSKDALLLIGRILLVVLFLISGFPKMTGFSGTVQYMASLHIPIPMLSAVIAVLMEVFASILIVIGFFTRPIAIIFALYTLGSAFLGHAYWNMVGDAVEPNLINFYKNVSIVGGFMLLAIVGPGSWSMDRR